MSESSILHPIRGPVLVAAGTRPTIDLWDVSSRELCLTLNDTDDHVDLFSFCDFPSSKYPLCVAVGDRASKNLKLLDMQEWAIRPLSIPEPPDLKMEQFGVLRTIIPRSSLHPVILAQRRHIVSIVDPDSLTISNVVDVTEPATTYFAAEYFRDLDILCTTRSGGRGGGSPFVAFSDFSTGKILGICKQHTSSICALIVHPTLHVSVTSGDCPKMLVVSTDGEVVAQVPRTPGSIYALFHDWDKYQFFVGHHSGKISQWDIRKVGEGLHIRLDNLPFRDYVNGICRVGPDLFAAGGSQGVISLWDRRHGPRPASENLVLPGRYFYTLSYIDPIKGDCVEWERGNGFCWRDYLDEDSERFNDDLIDFVFQFLTLRVQLCSSVEVEVVGVRAFVETSETSE